MGQMQKALAVYKKVAKAIPAYSPAHFNPGFLQLRQGRYSEAVDSLRQVVHFSTEDEEAHKALAFPKARMESAVSTLVFGATEG